MQLRASLDTLTDEELGHARKARSVRCSLTRAPDEILVLETKEYAIAREPPGRMVAFGRVSSNCDVAPDVSKLGR